MQLDRGSFQAARHFEMARDFLRRMREEIAARQAFEKFAEIVAIGVGRNQGNNALDPFAPVAIGVDALFIEAAIQIILGGNIKLPEGFRFPRSERLRIHGADVGIGKKAEQLEALGSAYFFGEVADRLRVENIAAEKIRGHFEMIGDEIADCAALGGVEAQAREDFIHGLQTSFDVIVLGHAFADIVEEKSEKQELRLFEFAEKIGKFLFPFGGFAAEILEIFDGNEGMGVHGVVMIEIANDERIDGREFREEADEDSLGVHRAEGVCGVRRDENLLEVRP